MYRVLRDVFCKTCDLGRFRLVHYSVQGNHIHLVVEAKNRAAMTAGMRRVNIRIGKQLNRARGRRKGRVLADRYDEQHLTSPRRARHGLAYALNNRRHHLAERGHSLPPRYWVDPFSSARHFPFAGRRACPLKDNDPIVAPQSWMLREGWARAGPISVDYLPAHRMPARGMPGRRYPARRTPGRRPPA